MFTLIKLAAYYSACAIISVLKHVNIDPDNFVGRVLDSNIWVQEGEPHYNPAPHSWPRSKALMESIQQKEANDANEKMSDARSTYIMTAAMLVPILALVAIPTVITFILVGEKLKKVTV